MRYDWRALEPGDPSPTLREAVGGHPLVAQLLAQRGWGDTVRARAFLDPTLYQPAPPSELPGMERATTLLRDAVGAGKRLRIWGDLDADGHTASAVLYEALSRLGARVDYRLPQPHEGHGLNRRAVEDALRAGIALLITCDTGIGDHDAIRTAVEGGLQVVVTDHHDLPETLPPAQTLIDPKMLAPDHPLYALSGAGVAYLLAQALLPGPAHAQALERMLDLVALGLVADVATQVDDVRYLVQRGMAVLRAGQRLGLTALARSASLDLAHATEEALAYHLGPRLNAAGRLGDSEMVVRLLVTSEPSEAAELADQVEALHADRRARIEATLARAEGLIEANPATLREPALVLAGEDWDAAVLGVVASELAQRYHRPAILIAHREREPSIGSARSVEGIDVHAAIAAQREHLLREGGHPMAAGFSLERDELEPFVSGLQSHLRAATPAPRAAPILNIDAELSWGELDLDLAREIERLAPFGAGNPQPIFSLRGGTLERLESLGRDEQGRHKRLHLSSPEGGRTQLIWFNADETPQLGEALDVALTLRPDHWHGRERLELRLVDWRPAGVKPREGVGQRVGGRQIVDLRASGETRALLDELRTCYGERLLIWAEGLTAPLEGACTRVDLLGRQAVALALATPPPDPQTLRAVLASVDPQLVHLLPPLPQEQLTLDHVLQSVLGMARAALRRHGGQLALAPMAARLGLPQATLTLALEYLQAAGKLALRRDGSDWRVEPGGAQLEDAGQSALRGRYRQALARMLSESQAYREAWAALPAEALLAASDG